MEQEALPERPTGLGLNASPPAGDIEINIRVLKAQRAVENTCDLKYPCD